MSVNTYGSGVYGGGRYGGWDDFARVLTEFARADQELAARLFATLQAEERAVLERRLGIKGQEPSPVEEIARLLKLTTSEVRQLEQAGLKKLRHPSRAAAIFRVLTPDTHVSDVLASVRELTPELIRHLQGHEDDLERIDPEVFEHLVGELLASAGFDEIRLVGRNPETSADVLAGYYIPAVDSRTRVFVEVKRWRNRIGVEVFNQVLGAMMSERDRFGWHRAMIIALGGATETRKFSGDEWRLKGLEVKDRHDLIRWLEGYRPNGSGLWVPAEEGSRE